MSACKFLLVPPSANFEPIFLWVCSLDRWHRNQLGKWLQVQIPWHHSRPGEWFDREINPGFHTFNKYLMKVLGLILKCSLGLFMIVFKKWDHSVKWKSVGSMDLYRALIFSLAGDIYLGIKSCSHLIDSKQFELSSFVTWIGVLQSGLHCWI